MIPYRDSVPSGRFPTVTVVLIALNLYVWFREWTLPAEGLRLLAYELGVVPARIDLALTGPSAPDWGALSTLVTATFLHSSWLHVLGNMLFLWVFGDNVEARLGHVGFAVFYLAVGVAGNLAHVLANPGSLVPAIGASGAVAGVLGAYLLLHPGARVRTLIFLGIFITVIEVPAVILLLYWFAVQLANGLFAFQHPGVATVAYWAHIGGFVAGMVLLRLFAPRTSPRWGP
ncbi:MAG: rhomboid family intramembrane serine protease [Clostridia bacterium]|nr:rhomboid family intramembrane serine protease [Clostridia bacterium]